MQRPIKIARPSAEEENEKIAIPSVTPWTHRGAGSAYELVTPAIVEPQPTTKPPPSSPGAAQRANRPGSATRIEVTAEPLSPPTIVEVQTPLRFSQSEGSIAPPNTELQGAKTEAKSPAAATEEATEDAAVEGTVEGTEVAIVVPTAQPATTTPAQQRDVGSAPRAAEIGFMEPTESQIMEKLHLAVGDWVVHLRTGHTIGFSVALYGPDGAKSRAMERARLDLLQEQGYTGDGKRLPPAKPGTAKAKLEGGGRVRTPASVPNQKRVTTAPTGQRASGSGQLVTQMAAKPMTPAALPLGVSSSLPTLATTVEEPAVATTTEPSPTVTAAAKPAEAGLVSASQRSSSPPIRGGSPPPQTFQQDDPELQLGSSPAATAGSPQPAPVTEVVGTRVGAASPSTALLRATSPQMVVRVPSGGGADMPWDQTSPNALAAAPAVTTPAATKPATPAKAQAPAAATPSAAAAAPSAAKAAAPSAAKAAAPAVAMPPAMEAPATLAEAVLSEEPIKRDRVLSAHEKAAAAQERRRLLEVQKKAEQAELAKKASMREAQMAERLAKKNAGIRMKEALARAAAEKKAEDRQKYNMLETARLLQIREEKARADAERKQLDDARKIEEKHRRRSAVEPTIPRVPPAEAPATAVTAPATAQPATPATTTATVPRVW